MTPFDFKPVVIIGAGRSGTNMLRDVLTAIPGIATWPCDEIQPIWRHSNLNHPTDAFTADMANASVTRFIRQAFIRQWKASNRPRFLVEKTCANTLRLPFLVAILPEAHFVVITRHGEDVVPSAMARWQGHLEVPPLSYFAAKARFIPLIDVPSYGARFLSNRVDKLRGKSTRLRAWGPIWSGFDPNSEAPLDEICADQWVACVGATRRDISAMPNAASHTSYEAFLGDPEVETAKILAAIGYGTDIPDLSLATATVRRQETGRGPRDQLSQAVKSILEQECLAHGYGVF